MLEPKLIMKELLGRNLVWDKQIPEDIKQRYKDRLLGKRIYPHL